MEAIAEKEEVHIQVFSLSQVFRETGFRGSPVLNQEKRYLQSKIHLQEAKVNFDYIYLLVERLKHLYDTK